MPLYTVGELLGCFLFIFLFVNHALLSDAPLEATSVHWSCSCSEWMMPFLFTVWSVKSVTVSQCKSLTHRLPSALTVTRSYGSAAVCAWLIWESPRATWGLEEHSTRELAHCDMSGTIRDITSYIWSHTLSDQYVDCAQFSPWSYMWIELIIWAFLVSGITHLETSKG